MKKILLALAIVAAVGIGFGPVAPEFQSARWPRNNPAQCLHRSGSFSRIA